jgi:hypothetical protein
MKNAPEKSLGPLGRRPTSRIAQNAGTREIERENHYYARHNPPREATGGHKIFREDGCTGIETL